MRHGRPSDHARRAAAPLATLIAAGALASHPAPASAATIGETVTGTALSALSLTVGTPAVFATNFAPGDTPSATGTLIAVDTNPNWTLSVQDTATGDPGHMVAAAVGCSGSDSPLGNPVQVTVTSALGGVTSAGNVSISGTAQPVASATSQLLAASVFTATYSTVIPSNEVMTAGCVYSMTATYTLQ